MRFPAAVQCSSRHHVFGSVGGAYVHIRHTAVVPRAGDREQSILRLRLITSQRSHHSNIPPFGAFGCGTMHHPFAFAHCERRASLNALCYLQHYA